MAANSPSRFQGSRTALAEAVKTPDEEVRATARRLGNLIDRVEADSEASPDRATALQVLKEAAKKVLAQPSRNSDDVNFGADPWEPLKKAAALILEELKNVPPPAT